MTVHPSSERHGALESRAGGDTERGTQLCVSQPSIPNNGNIKLNR